VEPDDAPSPVELVVVGLLLTAGVVLRFATTSPLWLDEALSVHIAELPLAELPEALRRDGHPPLYYALAHWWSGWFGTGDLAVRSLSGLLALAIVPLVALWARRRAGAVAAVWAAGLLAVLPFATRYATEARMYALVMLLVAAGALVLDRVLERSGWIPVAGLAIVTGALLYTHYWAIWLLAVVGAGLVWRGVRAGPGPVRAGVIRAVVGLGAGGVLFLPWVPVLVDQLGSTGTPWADPVRPTAALATTLVDLAGGRVAAESPLGAAVIALLVVLGLLGRRRAPHQVVLDVRTEPTVRREAIVAVATVVLGSVVAFVGSSAFESRYAAVVVPAVVVAAGAGAATIPGPLRRALVVGAMALVIAIGAVAGVVDQRTQAAEVADAITAQAGAGGLVVVCPDQLGPSTVRALGDAYEVVRVPDLADARFVDWRDYEARNAAIDPAELAERILARSAGEPVLLVWAGGYKTFGTTCEALVGELGRSRPPDALLAADGSRFFEPMAVYRFAG